MLLIHYTSNGASYTVFIGAIMECARILKKKNTEIVDLFSRIFRDLVAAQYHKSIHESQRPHSRRRIHLVDSSGCAVYSFERQKMIKEIGSRCVKYNVRPLIYANRELIFDDFSLSGTYFVRRSM